MPESPEVEALAEDLDGRLTGRALTAVDVVEFRTTKTRARPPEALVGATATGTARHGKLVDLSFGASQHLVVSFGRHGWARWTDTVDAGADDQPDDAPPAGNRPRRGVADAAGSVALEVEHGVGDGDDRPRAAIGIGELERRNDEHAPVRLPLARETQAGADDLDVVHGP